MLRLLSALVVLLAPSAAAQMDLRLDLEPLSAEIGQPVSLVLTAEHVPSLALELPKSVLPDDSWLLISDAQELTVPHPSREGLVITVVRWEIASLDSGERVFEFPDVRWGDGNTAGLSDIAAPTLKVAGALLEAEDAPRAALAFRDPVLPIARITHWPWVAGGLALLMLVVFLWSRKGGANSKRDDTLSPLTRLDALESRSEELGIRGSYFEMSALVRSALDEGGENLAGLTDEEWLAAREGDARSSEQEREALAALFARCQEVKYGQAEPTRWALEESLTTAKELARSAVHEQPEVAA